MSKIKVAVRDKALIVIAIIMYINLFMIGVFENRLADGLLTPIGQGFYWTQMVTFAGLIIGLMAYLLWAGEQKEEDMNC